MSYYNSNPRKALEIKDYDRFLHWLVILEISENITVLSAGTVILYPIAKDCIKTWRESKNRFRVCI